MKKIMILLFMTLLSFGAAQAAGGWSSINNQPTYDGNRVFDNGTGVSIIEFGFLNGVIAPLQTQLNNINQDVAVTSVADLNSKLYQYNNTRKNFVFSCENTTYFNYNEKILLPLNLQHNIDGNNCAVLNSTGSNAYIEFEGNNDNVLLKGFVMDGNFLVSGQLIKTSSNPPSENVRIIDVTVRNGNERLISYNSSITLRGVNILNSGGLVGSKSARGVYDVILDDVLITASSNQATGECYDANGHNSQGTIYMTNLRCEAGSSGHAWQDQGIDCNDAICIGTNLKVVMNESLDGQAYRIGSESLNYGSFQNIVATGIGNGGIGVYLDGAHTTSRAIGATVIGGSTGSECVRAIPQFGRGDVLVTGIQCVNTTYGINGTGAHASTRIHIGVNNFFNVTTDYVGDPHTFVFYNPEAEGQFKYINSSTTRMDAFQNLALALNLNNHSIRGSTLYDSSGFNNHATFTGTYLGNGGRTGGAIYLSQSGSNAITIPYTSSTDLTTSGTWCLWTDLHNMGTGTYFIMAKNWEKLGIEGRENRVRVFARNSSGSEFLTSYETIAEGEDKFNFFCGKFDGSILSLYVNGIQERTVSFNGNLQSGSGDFFVNKYGGGGYANQTVDEVLIFNEALTDQEIYNLYMKGFEVPAACVMQKDVTVDLLGEITIPSLAGSGTNYTCVDSTGKLFRC